ncbi:MAG: acyltransferase [Muribaculaceae bacterium]|jgi:fucose 4-O-acetylase-like acetyltransferase|nr:acyltransferase [Muribaculaceae bacterium]
MTNEKERVQYVDIAKGIAIIAVVLLHVRFNFMNNREMPVWNLLGGLWQVAVFFILGGFFIAEDKLEHPVPFIKRKIKTLYLILLYFYIPAVLLHNVFIDCGFYSTVVDYGGKFMSYRSFGETIKETLLAVLFAGREPILGPMWFVYVLFLAICGYSVLTWLLRKLVRDDVKFEWIRLIVLVALCSASCILSNVYGITVKRVSNTVTVMLLIYMGQQVYGRFKMKFNNIYMFIVCLLIMYHEAVIHGEISLNDNRYADMMHLVAGAGSALYVVCYISRKVTGTWIGKVIGQCGKNSYYIMALHVLGFKLCTMLLAVTGQSHAELSSLKPEVGDNWLQLCEYLIMGLGFPLVFMYAFRQVKSVLIKKKNQVKENNKL